MDVRHPRIEKTIKAFDQAEDFDPELVGTNYGAMNRRVQRRCVSTRGQDSNSFHEVIKSGPPETDVKANHRLHSVAKPQPQKKRIGVFGVSAWIRGMKKATSTTIR
jgi:hypothetical protein